VADSHSIKNTYDDPYVEYQEPIYPATVPGPGIDEIFIHNSYSNFPPISIGVVGCRVAPNFWRLSGSVYIFGGELGTVFSSFNFLKFL
jgi:hypothetical protein